MHRIAGTDSGFNHLIRPILYQAYHHIVNLSHEAKTAAQGDGGSDDEGDSEDEGGAGGGTSEEKQEEAMLATYDIAGNICESGDLLAKARSLPRVRSH